MTSKTATLAMQTITFVAMLFSPHLVPTIAQTLKSDIESNSIHLDDSTYMSWRDHLLPQPSELKWQEISWLNSFHAGLVEANQIGKPLLLWAMNGHPMGCT
jgi:hypothetical protein